MKLAVCVPIMNQEEVTKQSLNSFIQNQEEDVTYIFVDNGSSPRIEDWDFIFPPHSYFIRNEDNVGVLPALNQAYEVANKLNIKYIYYSHNDVLMFEKGWDVKIKRILDEVEGVGVAGFYGSKGIGTADIYTSPYRMDQLVRIENVSNCNRMDKAHGYRNIRGDAEWENVAVLDGFSLIIKNELLNKIGGFDTRTGVHHMYDQNICLDSLNNGYKNIVISMDAQHLGGRTDVGEDWATRFGKTKQQVHQEAHPPFYEKWHPAHVQAGNNRISLPVRVA